MKKLAIIHFQPLEYYPPIANLIDYLTKEKSSDFKSIVIYSSHNVKGRDEFRTKDLGFRDNLQSQNLKPKIFRSPFPKESDISIIRPLKYLHFNLFTLIGLLTYRPTDLLYYESYSAWPAYIYTKYINRKCRIFIHNHEYESKKEYSNMMLTVKYYHQLEKKWLYPNAHWISQTNKDRLEFFHQDHPYLKKKQLRVMPNYPPASWKGLGFRIKVLGTRKNDNHTSDYKNVNPLTYPDGYRGLKPIKLIYVGSISFQSTYLKELCEWVVKQKGKIQFDVYAYNLYSDVKEYLKNLNSPYINFFDEGIEYNDQPELLSKYDVGLILYKAHNQNYTYNAPNKLFEYLACDLDVWYPNVLEGPKPYNTHNIYPKVLPIDFENLDNFDFEKAIDKVDCEYNASEYFCEEVYRELVDEIVRS